MFVIDFKNIPKMAITENTSRIPNNVPTVPPMIADVLLVLIVIPINNFNLISDEYLSCLPYLLDQTLWLLFIKIFIAHIYSSVDYSREAFIDISELGRQSAQKRPHSTLQTKQRNLIPSLISRRIKMNQRRTNLFLMTANCILLT